MQTRLTFGVVVAQRGGPHVAQADGALAAAVDERVALVGVELGRRDHLRQLLHVRRLDVHNVWGWGRRVKEQQPPDWNKLNPLRHHG